MKPVMAQGVSKFQLSNQPRGLSVTIHVVTTIANIVETGKTKVTTSPRGDATVLKIPEQVFVAFFEA